jgi:hypothetical protein
MKFTGKKVYDGKEGGGNIIARFFLFQIKLISGFSFSLVSRQLFMAYIFAGEKKAWVYLFMQLLE